MYDKPEMAFCAKALSQPYLLALLKGQNVEIRTVKKDSQVSRPQPGCHYTTKLSLGGNNDVITELFLPRGSLVSDIPAGNS